MKNKAVVLFSLLALLAGCGPSPSPTQEDMLSDYTPSQEELLERIDTDNLAQLRLIEVE
ncbi:MAG: hypothetical protein JXA37_10970 [Chloroflexia bacterium]|nr:hypothetical protein [Chloroflexia bacterium]